MRIHYQERFSDDEEEWTTCSLRYLIGMLLIGRVKSWHVTFWDKKKRDLEKEAQEMYEKTGLWPDWFTDYCLKKLKKSQLK